MSECCLSTHPDFCKFWSIFDREDKISAFFICQIVSSCASIWNPVCTFRWLHLTITAVPCSFPSWRFGDMTHHQFKPVSLPAFYPSLSPCFFPPSVCHLSDWFPGLVGWFGSYRGTLCLQAKTRPDECQHTFLFRLVYPSSELIEELSVATSLSVCHWTGWFCVCCRGHVFIKIKKYFFLF